MGDGAFACCHEFGDVGGWFFEFNEEADAVFGVGKVVEGEEALAECGEGCEHAFFDGAPVVFFQCLIIYNV